MLPTRNALEALWKSYVHFGRQILSEILKKHSAHDEKLVEILYDKLYETFVREIDAIDNGIEIAENRKYEINTNLSARVSYFNPAWNQEHLNENVIFFYLSIFKIFFLFIYI